MATPAKVPKSLFGRQEMLPSNKKSNKMVRDALYSKAKVSLGDQLVRWNALKEKTQLKTHRDFAKSILDNYEQSLQRPKRPTTSSYATSSPIGHGPPDMRLTSIRKEELFGWESATGHSSVSGINPYSSSDADVATEPDVATDSGEEEKGLRHARQPKGFSSSFVDPFSVSIDIIQEEESDVDSDASYEPDDPIYDIVIGPDDQDNINEISFADDNFGRGLEDECSEDENFDDEMETVVPGVKLVRAVGEMGDVLTQETYLCYSNLLITLANTKIDNVCNTIDCNEPVGISTYTVGAAVYLKWVCQSGHLVFKWCSQPILKRGLHAGDLLTSACILFSGNNFQKVALMANMMNLSKVSSSTYLKIQRCYLVPAIEDKWNEEQKKLIDDLKESNEDGILLGDGRMDSPGHCAQYCTYTAMDNASKKVVSVITVDKRETGKSSIRMEKEAFLRTLTLQDQGVQIKEFVTDAHSSIAKHMRIEHPEIKHSFDVWHAAKNLAKKIMKAGLKKGCGPLKKWCKHIVNHFYHVCNVADSVEDFTGMWFGVIHHVVDEHEWLMDCGSQILECTWTVD